MNSPEQHLEIIVTKLIEDLSAKYHKGQQEHGGQLWQKPGMLKMLRQEHLDALVYEHTLHYQIQSALDYLTNGDTQSCAKILVDILDEPTDK
jgi:hypothetical protein